jgi:alkylation response protein AidB-like acyl-CoA dehydrogenase
MDMVTTVHEADCLYARYGKSLEQEHRGEYAAITSDGKMIVGRDDLEVGDRAIQQFGRGGFIL